MSATLFLAFCILGCDFLLYFLYQWTYGERRRGLSRRSTPLKSTMNQPDARPFLVSSRGSAKRGAQRLPSVGRESLGETATPANSAKYELTGASQHLWRKSNAEADRGLFARAKRYPRRKSREFLFRSPRAFMRFAKARNHPFYLSARLLQRR
jgi:hypothetical protein